ncbi:hypothetical protein FRC11_004285 [Ceratobasidium sp. 423]|nr:hypothetical protein FRC11_004285 [Ceratobasidium sp. 423]
MIIMLRRRRLRQANESYIHNPNQGPYQPQQYQHYPPQQYPTQPSYDPSQQWNNNNPYNNNQNNQQGGWNTAPPMTYQPNNQSEQYAPPHGAPPSYAPPAHPPPTKEHV